MPNPFPGMDPYLEAHWRDIYARLVIFACDALQGVLPGSLRARVEERVLLETPVNRGELVRGVPYNSRRHSLAETGAAIAVAEPLLVETQPESVTETFIEIIHRESGNRVVTVIAFLSPSNKSPGPNREQYLRKQGEICSSEANLVEVDLNRFGTHTLAFPLAHLKPVYRTPYMACVRRVTRRGNAEVYPMPLSARLPVLKIPLRPEDADVPLDLQALVEQCYRNGAYESTLNYSADPHPSLAGADEDWAEKLLHEKGLRAQRKAPRRKGRPKSR